MGTFINLGNDNLMMDRNDSIYVDKSLLISNLNKVVSGRERFLCFSRPRRFGKSMAANMIVPTMMKAVILVPFLKI